MNAYLGMCIAFINEIGDICTKVGADVREVERALRFDPRVGQGAPLRAGKPFTSGHIERDLNYLQEIHVTHLLTAILNSNEERQGYFKK